METLNLNIIGENIRKYREQVHLTQSELAEKVGVGVAFVSRVERGEKLMKLKTLLSFADALNVSAGQLLYQDSKDEQLQTIMKMLEGQSPEFIDGIIALLGVCVEKFDNKQENSLDM